MKTLISISAGLILALSFLITPNNIQETLKTYIVGNWVEEGNTINDKWVFSTGAEGKCTKYSDGKVLDTYTYTLTTEKSQNGKFTFNVLTLKSLSNSKIVLDYVITGFGDKKMYMEFGGKPGSLLSFNKVN